MDEGKERGKGNERTRSVSTDLCSQRCRPKVIQSALAMCKACSNLSLDSVSKRRSSPWDPTHSPARSRGFQSRTPPPPSRIIDQSTDASWPNPRSSRRYSNGSHLRCLRDGSLLARSVQTSSRSFLPTLLSHLVANHIILSSLSRSLGRWLPLLRIEMVSSMTWEQKRPRSQRSEGAGRLKSTRWRKGGKVSTKSRNEGRRLV